MILVASVSGVALPFADMLAIDTSYMQNRSPVPTTVK